MWMFVRSHVFAQIENWLQLRRIQVWECCCWWQYHACVIHYAFFVSYQKSSKIWSIEMIYRLVGIFIKNLYRFFIIDIIIFISNCCQPSSSFSTIVSEKLKNKNNVPCAYSALPWILKLFIFLDSFKLNHFHMTCCISLESLV
jgi:hypothetical protein